MAVKKTPAKKTTTTKKASSSKSVNSLLSPKAQERKWEIESALNTLKRADEIRKNAKMMSEVKALAEQQMNVLKGIK